MFIDSHCHLDLIDLEPYQNNFDNFMQAVKQSQIDHMLCISIDLETYPAMQQFVSAYNSISITVGVHPNVQNCHEPTVDELVSLGQNERVIGIGETGLDYFRSEGDLNWQQERFRTHIRAAKKLKKPLIVHTREAKQDTIKILTEEGAEEVGGVLHCFTEDWTMAKQALDLNFYISFSGIVTFKNAAQVQEVAKKVPDNRYLIETDSPYLAPVPFRGKTNYPIYVRHVAEQLSNLRNSPLKQIAEQSSRNFHQLFTVSKVTDHSPPL
ncbi:MAG: TatD family hydrolase [Endozoicomonadaceae bacterium]|nr:TatD family hydrolase [Endozoicomonadaceae bacterium]